MSEDNMRQLLLSLDRSPGTPDPVARVRRRIRRRSAAVGVVAFVAAVGAGAVTALATRSAGPSGQALVPAQHPPVKITLPDVPFAARPYPPLTIYVASPTERFCGGSDLTLAATTAPREANAIGVQLTVRLTNTSKTACQVPFRGAVTITSPTGTAGHGSIGSNLAVEGVLEPAVPPAGTALLTGYWAQPCKSPVVPVTATVSLTRPDAPSAAPVSVSGPVKAGPAPTCRPPLKVAYLGGTASLYSLVVLDAQQRRVDKPTLSLTAELVDVPTAVRAGQLLRFGVRLHNPTAGPIPLAGRSCPLYATLLNRPGRSAQPEVDGSMNCPAGPAALPAGASVTFRFQFLVSAPRFRPGGWTLYWTRTDGGQQLQASLRVTPAT